jgi:hypothetical protein
MAATTAVVPMSFAGTIAAESSANHGKLIFHPHPDRSVVHGLDAAGDGEDGQPPRQADAARRDRLQAQQIGEETVQRGSA